MSTDPSFRCSQCHKYKLPAEYGMRQRSDRHGAKGDRFSICLSCSADNSASRKRKRVENNPGHPAKRVATQHPATSSQLAADVAIKHVSASEIDDSSRISLDDHPEKGLATQPHASPSQLMEALAKYASAAEIDHSWRVSVDEVTKTDKDNADHLASPAWEATGYRFSSHTSSISAHKGYRTGIDGLFRESEPDGFTEPPSLEEQYEMRVNGALRLLALLRSQQSHPNPDWLARFDEESNSLYKFVNDNFRDETSSSHTPEDQ